jgi:hypothetical protein
MLVLVRFFLDAPEIRTGDGRDLDTSGGNDDRWRFSLWRVLASGWCRAA